MNVELLAWTETDHTAMEAFTEDEWHFPWFTTDSDGLAEFAGRNCYQSWDRPNPATAGNEDYLANIDKQKHYSVLGHASVTFGVSGVSRALTAELIRSRFLVFSELSQRYLNMADADCVTPSVFDDYLTNLQFQHWEASKSLYELTVKHLGSKGITGKKAREAARYVLPIGAETKIVVSGNIRAWRDFINQRMTPSAMDEIRQFAETVYGRLLDVAPNSMQGIG